MLPTTGNGTSTITSLLFDDWPIDRIARQLNVDSINDWQSRSLTVDLAEQDDHFAICMDVPGVNRSDIDLSIEDRVLSIKVERKTELSEGAKYLHRGRWHGSTVKKVTLPESASSEEIEAILRDGVLMVKVAKAPEKQPRKIEIKQLN